MTHVARYGVAQHPVDPIIVGDYGVIKPLAAWAPYFDGVDNYIELDSKLLDITGDIDFSFTFVGTRPSTGIQYPIYVQGSSDGGTSTSVEFRLAVSSSTMTVIVGGFLTGGNVSYAINSGDTIRVTIIGSTITWYANGVQLYTGTYNRGGVVSADPKAYIGRNNPGLLGQPRLLGVVHGIVANGVSLGLYGNNVATYESIPAGVVGTPIGFTSVDYRLVEVP